MIKKLLFFLFVVLCFFSNAQCPLVYNSQGTPTNEPVLAICTGSTGTINFIATSSFGTYTINWGDSGPVTTGSSYSMNTPIAHSYPATVTLYTITLTVPSLSCTMNSTMAAEKPVNASIQIPTLGITTTCAPKTLTFTNSSTDVSPSTTFTWDFGDGSPPVVASYTNGSQNITHLYNKGTVNCQTQVTLKAQNYCSFGNPSTANYNPISIYDKDSAIININKILSCWPDNVFTFSNSSIRNCNTQGNTFQRQEKWNFGNYWNTGSDSIIGWRPWPPANPISVAYPNVGTYTAKLLDSNLCGVSSRVITFIITQAPTASIVVPSGPACQNTAITFTNACSSGYSYRWDFGTGAGFTNLGSGDKTFTYTAPGTYTVRLKALVNGAGPTCSDTAFAVVNILPAPTASFATSPTVGCGTLSNVIFSNQSNGHSSSNWNFNNGTTSTLNTPPNQTYTAGLYTPTLTVVSASGCVSNFTGSLLVRHNPAPAFTQFTTCVASAINFTNNSTVSGTNAITGYTWHFGDGNPASTSTAPAHTYTTANTFTVKLLATTGFCTDSLFQTVFISVKPTASFIISPSVSCSPFAATFSNTSLNAGSYLWNFGTSPAATLGLNNPTVGFTYANATQGALSYTVSLIATTGQGCADTTRKTVSVLPNPMADFITNTATGCSPLLTTFTNNSIGYTGSAWAFGDGGTSTLTNPSHTFTNTTLFTQTVSTRLIVSNGFGCTDSIKRVVTIYPQALPQFTVQPTAGCHPMLANFPAIPGIVTYSWNHGSAGPTFTTNNSHSWIFNNTGSTSIVFTISMTAKTSNGCIGSNSQTVTVYANPTANFSFAPGSACAPAAINFTNQSAGNITNIWDFGNGLTSSLANPFSSYTAQPGAAQTSFSVKLLIGSTEGCKDSLVKTFTLLPQPKALFTPDTPACSPKTISFNNTSIYGNTYKWDFGDNGATSTASNASHYYINNSSTQQIYNVKLVAISANNCRDSNIVQIKVYPKPVFSISSAPDSGCAPIKVFFRKLNGVIKYDWKYDNIGFGSSGVDFSNSFDNKGLTPKFISIQLIAADAHQCSDTASKLIKVYPRPEAKYSASPMVIYLPNQTAHFTNLSTGATVSSWLFGDGTGVVTPAPVHTYINPGEYTTSLIVTNTYGCRDTFSLPEKLIALNETTVSVPNAFTPNPDGPKGRFYDPKDLSNDIFYPNIKGAEKYTFSIYSRWGELLFETTDTREGWDGYYRGKLCTQDVYIWKINATFIDGRTYNKSGNLLLLK